jgi:acetyl-CoA acetyltransferase
VKRRDVAIVGYHETKFERRSGRSIYDVAGEALVQFAAGPAGEAPP